LEIGGLERVGHQWPRDHSRTWFRFGLLPERGPARPVLPTVDQMNSMDRTHLDGESFGLIISPVFSTFTYRYRKPHCLAPIAERPRYLFDAGSPFKVTYGCILMKTINNI